MLGEKTGKILGKNGSKMQKSALLIEHYNDICGN
jgi:hypothetical protein